MLGVLYAVSPELQWHSRRGGLAERQPGHGRIGVRWKFAPAGRFPSSARAAAGMGDRAARGALRGRQPARRHVSRGGRLRPTRGRPSLDHEYVDYRELAASAGVRWQLSPTTTLQAGVGRVFDGGSSFTNAICCSTATAPPWSSSAEQSF